MLSKMVAEKMQRMRNGSFIAFSCESRVAGCAFEAAIFTNLTQDHLDFHKTMEDYF